MTLFSPKSGLVAGAIAAVVVLSGCASPATSSAVYPTDSMTQAVSPVDLVEGSAAGPEEPVTVTVLGDIEMAPDGSIPVEELVQEAEALGQDVSDALDVDLPDEGAGVEAPTSEVESTIQAAAYSRSAPSVRLAAVNPYDQVSIWKDNQALKMALRKGNSAWGWAHAQRHSVTESMIQKTTKFPKSRTATGTTIVYETPANEYTCWAFTGCKITRTATVRVVANRSVLSDGWPKGVITSYCVDPKSRVCPAWVAIAA